MARIIIQADDGTEFENVRIQNGVGDSRSITAANELQAAMRLIVKALFKALAQDDGRDPRLY